MLERINEATAALLVAAAGALTWFVRTALTNQAELKALRDEIADRQRQRADEAKALAKALERIHSRIDEVDKDIKTILRDRADDLKAKM